VSLKKYYCNWKYWHYGAKRSEVTQVYLLFGLVGHSSAFTLGMWWLSWQHSRKSIARYLTVSMATVKQPEAGKCVAYKNSSPWYILKSKNPLCICNDMLIYIIQV